ncbi:hypothetical protein LR48_Vigan09g148200 [Vigna angularis]|uniref:Uncharacterized protein n=1 Tax=Phaseolus angularis TaxID=3914 RepID=A0A0L9VCT0_PHAAN|nr:hypothetical protein LR48_Vigan09g148200 [Vigna angularis]
MEQLQPPLVTAWLEEKKRIHSLHGGVACCHGQEVHGVSAGKKKVQQMSRLWSIQPPLSRMMHERERGDERKIGVSRLEDEDPPQRRSHVQSGAAVRGWNGGCSKRINKCPCPVTFSDQAAAPSKQFHVPTSISSTTHNSRRPPWQQRMKMQQRVGAAATHGPARRQPSPGLIKVIHMKNEVGEEEPSKHNRESWNVMLSKPRVQESSCIVMDDSREENEIVKRAHMKGIYVIFAGKEEEEKLAKGKAHGFRELAIKREHQADIGYQISASDFR